MNAKLISAVLGTLAMSAPMMARADEAPAKSTDTTATTATKTTKSTTKKTKAKKADAKGGEKSCGADGKSCGGK